MTQLPAPLLHHFTWTKLLGFGTAQVLGFYSSHAWRYFWTKKGKHKRSPFKFLVEGDEFSDTNWKIVFILFILLWFSWIYFKITNCTFQFRIPSPKISRVFKCPLRGLSGLFGPSRSLCCSRKKCPKHLGSLVCILTRLFYNPTLNKFIN